MTRLILRQAEVQRQQGRDVTDVDIANSLEALADRVGWVRAKDELAALRGYVADQDKLIDLPITEEPVRPINYDAINGDHPHHEEES